MLSSYWGNRQPSSRLDLVAKTRSRAIVAAIFLAISTTPSQASVAVTFQTTSTLPVGFNPISIVVGYFNPGAAPDIAVANFGQSNISVMLGNGNGTFGPAATFAAGPNPRELALGDFNGDKITDFAVTNITSDTVRVLLGNGLGFFGSAVSYPVGSLPEHVVVGDFNGDHNADMAVCNHSSHNVSILLGNGLGTFAAATNFPSGSAPDSMASGDFNGDGYPDLAVANDLNTGTVAILMCNGAGGFSAPTYYPVGVSPQAVTVGDFNGDGKVDIAVANTGNASNNVSILLGTGTGTFGPANNFGVGTNPRGIAVGDFNGDGKPDLAVVNENAPSLSVLVGDGTGGFAPQLIFPTGNNPTEVAVGDLNGDGKPDLVTSNNGNDNVTRLLNSTVPDVTELADTKYTTGTDGWVQVGSTTAKQQTHYEPGVESLVTRIGFGSQDNDYRIIGWLSAPTDTIHYSSVGTNHFIRAKYYIYATGQISPAVNVIPNFRIRVASRFAYSAILQPYNHDNTDPEGTALAQDIHPSTSSLFPSIYRVDLDPPDVPQLTGNASTEGFLRIFEAYEAAAQAQGDLGMTESTIGTYPALIDYSTTVPVTQNGLIKSYRAGANGGSFGNGNIAQTNSAITILKYHNGVQEFGAPLPTVTINNAGVTLETLSVETDRLGVAALDVFNDPGDQGNRLTRARVEPGKQYRIRFHATSTKQSNTQALMRFRVRTLKFLYTSSLEVGSSQAQDPGNANNTIAAQVLPGIGNQLPAFDRINPSENGGWYNVLMMTPINPDIQVNQPHIMAQDAPGVNTGGSGNSKSRRDIQFGIDIIDTFSTKANAVLESGQMTVDRVDIEKYERLSD